MNQIGWFLSAACAAALATIGAILALYARQLGRVRRIAAVGSSVVETDAGPIEYAASGAGVPLLSIHGAGGGFDQGRANAAELVGDGYRVVAPSRFGYLRTPIPPDASSAAQADAHAALLAKLNIPRAIVVGVSAGARSAVELAIRNPEQVAALILVSPALYAPENPVAVDASRGGRFAFWVVNVGGDFAWWAGERIAPSILIRFMGVPSEAFAAAPRAERDRVMRIVDSVQPLSQRFPGINVDSAPQSAEPPLGQIAAPTLVISARDDLFNTLPAAAFAASKIAAAKLVVYDSGGHLLLGRRAEVRAAVQAFLAGIKPPGGRGTR